MMIRPATHVYRIAVVSNTDVRAVLCDALKTSSSDVTKALQASGPASFEQHFDVHQDGEKQRLRLMVDFYNLHTHPDESCLDATVFAFNPNEHEEADLIQCAASTSLAGDGRLLVQVFDDSQKTKNESMHHSFSDFYPNNHFELTMTSSEQFLEKLFTRLVELRLAREALSAAYRASVSESPVQTEVVESRRLRINDSHPALAALLARFGINGDNGATNDAQTSNDSNFAYNR